MRQGNVRIAIDLLPQCNRCVIHGSYSLRAVKKRLILIANIPTEERNDVSLTEDAHRTSRNARFGVISLMSERKT
jgi:hypothetical protein